MFEVIGGEKTYLIKNGGEVGQRERGRERERGRPGEREREGGWRERETDRQTDRQRERESKLAE